MAVNQTGWNRALSLNFGWLRSANYMKFTERFVMCTEKKVFRNCFFYK